MLPTRDEAGNKINKGFLGKPLTMTPNILTGPTVKAVCQPYKHLPDEYDRLRML